MKNTAHKFNYYLGKNDILPTIHHLCLFLLAPNSAANEKLTTYIGKTYLHSFSQFLETENAMYFKKKTEKLLLLCDRKENDFELSAFENFTPIYLIIQTIFYPKITYNHDSSQLKSICKELICIYDFLIKATESLLYPKDKHLEISIDKNFQKILFEIHSTLNHCKSDLEEFIMTTEEHTIFEEAVSNFGKKMQSSVGDISSLQK